MQTTRRIIRGARRRRRAVAWTLYDLGDTLFSGAILTFYFPLWLSGVVGDDDDGLRGGVDALFAFAVAGSMLGVIVVAPLAGSISDRLRRRVPLLATAAIVAAVCVIGIGRIDGVAAGIALFMIANFAYQLGVVFHNSLIVNITSLNQRSLVSGLGVGTGFAALAVLFIALDPIVERYGDAAAFIPIALVFVALAVPLMLVKERGTRHPVNRALFVESYLLLFATFQRARRHANFFRFILARFLYTEATSTFALFLLLFLLETRDIPADEARMMVIGSVVVAAVAGWVGGFIEAKTHPRTVLIASIVGWVAIMVLAIGADASWTWAYWIVVVSSGALWATTQLSDRVVLTELAPKGQVGEFFGLFQISGRRAAFVGPAVWGLEAWLFPDSRVLGNFIAVAFMIVLLGAALVLLTLVREIRERPDLIHMETHGGRLMRSSE